MGRGTIEMNFQRANQQASELEEIAGELKTIANQKMTDSMGKVSSSWRSENATKYLRKAGTVQGNIKRISTELQSAATTIRSIAKITHDAELHALELAQARKVN